MVTLTPSDVALIAAVRVAFRERQDYPETTDEGRLAESLEQAQSALFRVLNVAQSYCGVRVSHEQMHGSLPLTLEPQDTTTTTPDDDDIPL